MAERKADHKQVATPQAPPQYLWRSGDLVEWDKATVHVTAVAWSAISAVFEGIRAYWNPDHRQLYVFQLDTHLKRLVRSMKIMRMASPYSQEELAQAVITLLRANDYHCDTYIQPLAYFGRGVPGYLAVLEEPGEIVITARPWASNIATDAPKVVHCNISSWTRISDNAMPPRAKAIANYQNSRYVSTESRINGYDFGIILNADGKVAEASYACIYISRDGVAITPPVSAGILESITWDVVRRLLEEDLAVPVVEREVDRTELYVADEAFLCGTAVEAQAIGSVDRYKVGSGEAGPVVSRLHDLFHKIARRQASKYSAWSTPVYAL